jgi:hypothetical protein
VQETVLLSGKKEFPATWLFQTREGAMGILQITGSANNPPGVRIRYKLVRDATATHAASTDASKSNSAVVSASFAEPPTLQFITWQDEWKTNQLGAGRGILKVRL